MSRMPEILPGEFSDRLITYIVDHAAELMLSPDDSEPLGMRIFTILEQNCTVLYYPIDDTKEDNAAFLLADVPMQKDGDVKSVVFINTFQTTEKQVFSAAHELGHLWRLPQYLGVTRDEALEERIVNRFASELLMPGKLFRKDAEARLNAVPGFSEARRIKLSELLEIIVWLMDRFLSPYENVVARMVELNILGKDIGALLIEGDEKTHIEDIRGRVQTIVSASEYTRLQTRSRRREIKGLSEMLDLADSKGIHKPKVAFLRDAFGLHDIDTGEAFALNKMPEE